MMENYPTTPNPCIIFLLVIMLFNVKSEGNEPMEWESDLKEDCPQCLLTRQFECNGSICESGIYRDNLYLDGFVNNCFGKQALNSEDIDNFLQLLYSNQTGWEVPLKKLTNVLKGSGLIENLQYATRTKCANMKPKGVRKRYNSTITYHCPINSSAIWKDEFRYCGTKDRVVKYSNCICVDNIGIIIKTTTCLNEQGFLNKSCETRSTVSCECPFKDSTKSPINQTKFTRSTIPDFNDNGYKAAVLVLCLFVIILLVSIITYCIWKMNKKEQFVLPPETSLAAHHSVSNILLNREDGYFNVTTPPSSIYQTIGNNSSPPALPLRLFSLSSVVTDTMRSRPTLPSTSRNDLIGNEVIITPDDQKYASIKSNKEYDLPPLNDANEGNLNDGASPWGQNGGYEIPLPGGGGFNLGSSLDERLNPLYASEDEMTDH